MAYVTDCPDHESCNLIVSEGWPDRAGSWVSHFDDDVDPAARLNPDDSEQAMIEDRRSSTDTETVNRRTPTVRERERITGERPVSSG